MHNRHAFRSLAHLGFTWTVLEDGLQLASGILATPDLAPGATGRLEVDLQGLQRHPDREYHLTLTANTIAAEPLLEAGWVVAWEQFALPGAGAVGLAWQEAAARHPAEGRLELVAEDQRWVVKGEQFSAAFSRRSGELVEYRYRGEDLILQGPRPNYWRPPTDNDLGNGMQDWAAVWRDAIAGRSLEKTAARRIGESMVRVETVFALAASAGQVAMNYLLWADGVIEVEQQLQIFSGDLPKLPRVGTQMVLPSRFQHVRWFGRGPHENYADRNTSAPLGLYGGPVIDQFHRYPRPQETGNRTDVRWMALVDESGVGLLATGEQPLSCSVWPFTMDDLDFRPGAQGSSSASGLVPVTSRHGAELVARDLVTWNIDHRQMGVGGDTSWGRMVHEQYSIPAVSQQYRFRLIPFATEDVDPIELARQHRRSSASTR